jgi:DNA-binding HxlR family transcriptional regulator
VIVHVEQDSVLGAVTAVGDAWSWLVLREAIFTGVDRFDEFQHRLGIARSTLTARLDQLTSGGLLQRAARGRYVLADRGADFVGCLLTAMAWGDRWTADGGPVPLVATHVGCGRPMSAQLRCSACREPLRPQDVRFESRPAPRLRGGDEPRNRTPALDLLERGGPSSVARTLQVIGDRWSALIIREAFFGVRRFDEFQHDLAIATNILAQRLDRLVAQGVLGRVPYQRHPVREEYRLTEKGLDLYPVPLAMLTWGDRWLAQGKKPVPLVHQSCGDRFTAVLCCDQCGQAIRRSDVTFG